MKADGEVAMRLRREQERSMSMGGMEDGREGQLLYSWHGSMGREGLCLSKVCFFSFQGVVTTGFLVSSKCMKMPEKKSYTIYTIPQSDTMRTYKPALCLQH